MDRNVSTAVCITLLVALSSCKDTSSDTAPPPVADTGSSATTPTTPAEPSDGTKKVRPKTAQLTADDVREQFAQQANEDAINPFGVKRVPYTFMDGRLTIEIPETFRPMTEKELEIKYPGKSRPGIAYTASSIAINLTATHTNEALLPSQIYQYHKLFEQEMKRTFPQSKWISNVEVRVDDQDCWLSQFRNQLIDMEVYNMVLGTSVNNRLMLITFTMPQSLEGVWIPMAEEILMGAKFSNIATPAETAPPE